MALLYFSSRIESFYKLIFFYSICPTKVSGHIWSKESGSGGVELFSLLVWSKEFLNLMCLMTKKHQFHGLLTPYTVAFTTKQLIRINSWSILCCRYGSTMFLIPVWLMTKGVKTGFPGTKINLNFLVVVHNSFMVQMNTWIISLR